MTGIKNKFFWSRLLLYLTCLNLVVILLSILGRILFDLEPFTAFQLLFFGIQIGGGLALISLIVFIISLSKKQVWPAIGTTAVTVLLGVCPILVSILVVGISGFSAPMIHDISTDTINPPSFVAVNALRKPGENSLDYAGEKIAVLQRQAFPDIQTLNSHLSPDDAMTKSLSIIESLGWSLVDSNKEAGRIEASDKSFIFGFIDDVVIRVSPEGTGSRIDLRAVSRVGMSDLGANAKRIRKFVAKFNSD